MKYIDIENFKGLYQVTNTGKVYCFPRKVKMPNGGFKIIKEHHPKLSVTNKGYLKVMLTNSSGIRKGFFVHRLVAQTFLVNEFNKPQVNHKDRNTKNNNVKNLEWVTNRENCIHAQDKTKTSSKYYGVTKNKNRWQAQCHINKKNIYIGMFKTQEEARDAVSAFELQTRKVTHRSR